MANTTLFYNRNACISIARISKQTVVAILGYNYQIKAGDTVSWTSSEGITQEYRVESIGRTTMVISLNDIKLTVNKKEVKKKDQNIPFLLEIDQSEWEIISFNPKTREVCIKITKTDTNLSLILPEMA